MAPLFAVILFTSEMLLTDAEVAELASKRFMPEIIRSRSPCKSITAEAEGLENGKKDRTSTTVSNFLFISIPFSVVLYIGPYERESNNPQGQRIVNPEESFNYLVHGFVTPLP